MLYWQRSRTHFDGNRTIGVGMEQPLVKKFLRMTARGEAVVVDNGEWRGRCCE